MGVQSAGTGGGVFILREQPFQFSIFLCPVILIRVKGICQTAPTHILGKHLLFLGGGTTVLLLQLEQGTDGFDVPGEFLFGASDTQIIIRDVEVPGRHSIQGFIQGSGIREGLHLSVHHGRDGQFVQFFVGKFRLNLPQAILELLLIDKFVIPRLPLRAGVDANIGFTYIADFALDGSCEKVYHNIVPDLIVNGLFGSSVKGLVLLFVQFPDNR